MINIQKQVDYWLKGAEEERSLAADLFVSGRDRHGLFFLHLMIEKIMKAHVSKKILDVPPKSHNLVLLAEKAMLLISAEDRYFLSTLSRFNLEGRYPDSYEELPSAASVEIIKQKSEQMYQWLLEQLKKQ